MATEKKNTDPKTNELGERMVKVRLPITREEKDPLPVWVNDRSWLIKRGVEVEVPECCAEVLRHREESMEVQIAYEEGNARTE